MSLVRAGVRKLLRRAIGFDELAKRVTKQEEKLTRQRDRLDAITPTARRAHTLLEVLAAQNSAIEERLQSLTEQVERHGYDATDVEKTEARKLIDEVREEHRRIRVRFGVVTRYEERLRRLESALAEEMAAAAALAKEAAQGGALANAPTHGAVDIPEGPVADAPAGS
jgi:DNA repair exonuclease SbcCD ATPase subunit